MLTISWILAGGAQISRESNAACIPNVFLESLRGPFNKPVRKASRLRQQVRHASQSRKANQQRGKPAGFANTSGTQANPRTSKPNQQDRAH